MVVGIATVNRDYLQNISKPKMEDRIMDDGVRANYSCSLSGDLRANCLRPQSILVRGLSRNDANSSCGMTMQKCARRPLC